MTASRRRRRPQLDTHADETPDSYSGAESMRMPPAPSERVQQIVRRAQARRENQGNDIEDDVEESSNDLSPQSRLEQVQQRAPEYEREYRLKLVHRLLIRKIPLDEIAEQLDVSLSTVKRDRRELYQRLGNEASRLDMNNFLGETMAFYGEAGAMAMRIATSAKTATPHRLAALRTAMSSKKELGQFFAVAGVFDALKFIPKEETQSGDLARLLALSERILEEDDDNVGVFEAIDKDELYDDSLELLL